MSDANLAAIAYRQAGSASYQALRYTGEDFKFNKETAQSQEIRDDGQIPDLAKVGGQPEGGFNFELSFLGQQAFLAAVLRSGWVEFGITISATLSAATQTATAAAGTFDEIPVGALVRIAGAANEENNGLKRTVGKAADGSTLVFIAGSIVEEGAAANLTFSGKTLVNGNRKVETDFEKRIVNSQSEDFFLRYEGMVADSMELTIESKRIVTGSFRFIGKTYDIGNSGDSAGAVDAAAASGVLTLSGNATEGESVLIGGSVWTFTETAEGDFEVLIGADAEATIDNLVDEINNGAEGVAAVTAEKTSASTMTVTADTVGVAGNSIETVADMADGAFGSATLTGGVDASSGYLETVAGDVMNGTNNMGTILMDGQEATDRFKSISLTIANNVRGKDALSYDGNFDTGLGTISVTGSFNAYFLNNTLPAKIKDHTSFSLSFFLQDAAGNQLHFYLPSAKPANGDPAITGINTDVMIQTGFQALLDRQNGTGRTIIIDAIAAA